METLNTIRSLTRLANLKFDTIGLDNHEIEKFLNTDLQKALKNALINLEKLLKDPFYSKILQLDENKQITYLQKDILNFYEEKYINPYVPLSAHGPWIITTFGSVIYDVGGYGMLAFGHNPDIINYLSKEQTMANVMTAQFIHAKFTSLLDQEIGSKFNIDSSSTIYNKYIFLNSGSEAMALALRLADVLGHLKGPDIKKDNIITVSFKGSFHGRLDRAARCSDSSIASYKKHLASYQDNNNIAIRPNNIEDLEKVFIENSIETSGKFIDCLVLEPVMGEGCPGLSITKEFYERARELTKIYGSLLIIDSVQAGFRANGYLSICDYFDQFVLEPDIEVFSKSINGGQVPLSVIALNKTAVDLYKYGIYGNTMTGNPRSLEIGSHVLEIMSERSIKQNIQNKGLEFLNMLKKIALVKDKIIECQGTGLLLSIKMSSSVDIALLERNFRMKGLGIIHGSNHSLRFTPNFLVTNEEIDLIYRILSSNL